MDEIGDWRRTKYAGEIGEDDYQAEMTVAGWLQDIRNLGGIAFIILRDRTGTLQVTAIKKMDPDLFKRITELARESVVMVRGTVQPNEQVAAGFEVLLKELKVLGQAKTPLPLGVVDKVSADLDTRLDNRFLDVRKPDVAAIFKIRHTILDSVHDRFVALGFVEVHTPKVVATATEGGTSLFPMRYFDREAYLNQSPQLFKQMLMATGLDRVFEIGPAFRAESHDTVRHLNEFISIDMEMSFADENDVMDVLEDIVYHSILEVNNRNQEELGILGVDLDVPPRPFPRVTYSECIDLLGSEGVEVAWGEDIDGMEAVKTLAVKYPGFYFITQWPTEIKPFYVQPFLDRQEVCRGFDLNYGEKEITSGAQRVHDPELLKSNLAKQGLDPDSFEFYIKAFEYGMPPHAGWGLGAERLTMILTQRQNIRECVLFPRDRYRLVP